MIDRSMPLFRVIGREAFARDWLAIWEDITGGENLCFNEMKWTFAHEEWMRAAIPDAFLDRPRSFEPECDHEGYPPVPYIPYGLVHLFDVVREQGCERMILTSLISGAGAHRPARGNEIESRFCILDPTMEAMQAFISTLEVNDHHWMSAVLFDVSGEWAAAYGMDRVTFVGGVPRVMEPFIERSGGHDAMYMRLYFQVNCVDPCIPDDLTPVSDAMFESLGWHKTPMEDVFQGYPREFDWDVVLGRKDGPLLRRSSEHEERHRQWKKAVEALGIGSQNGRLNSDT